MKWRFSSKRDCARTWLTALLLLNCSFGWFSGPVFAVPITVTDTFHFLDNRSDNSVGVPTGIRQNFGALYVIPNADTGGTVGVATQTNQAGTFFSADLLNRSTSVYPDAMATSRPADNVPNGSWTLTFTNGANTTIVNTPTIAGATVVPFVNSVTTSPGITPTFNWAVPTTFTPDAVRIEIRDTTNFIGTGGAGGDGVGNLIYLNVFTGNTSSFTVNSNDPRFKESLLTGRTYSLSIQLLDLRTPLNALINLYPQGENPNVLSRSQSFFDFVLLPGNAPANVFLPTLVPGAQPFYKFNVQGIIAGQTIFVDPLVAVGYTYQISAGDPNFRSVTLPTGIGDNLFDLFLFDFALGIYVDSGIDLVGGLEHFFGALGIDRFSIRGIETSAGLDPNNTLAFITGLSFVADGQFTGTMTPLILAVPEPSIIGLFALGLVAFGFSRRKKA